MTRLALAALAAALCLGPVAAAQTPVHPRPVIRPPGLSQVDIDTRALDRIVGDHKVVVFGEDSHEMAAEHDAFRQIAEHLAARKGFRVIVFESQWGVEDAFEGFMASDRTTLDAREQFFLDGAFASTDTAKLLIWVRDFNRAHPHDPVRISGFQPEQPVTDFHALWSFFAKAAPDDLASLQASATPCRAGDPVLKTDFDFMAAGRERRKVGEPTYSPPERKACLAALDALDAYLARHLAALARRSSSTEVQEAQLHVMSLRGYVDIIRRIADEVIAAPDAPATQQASWQGEIYDRGDGARFELFKGLLKTRYGGKKLLFWMHDWHAAKHASETGLAETASFGIPLGTRSVGERLAGFYGGDLVSIGSLVPCGTTCEEPADSLEPPFAARFGDKAAFVDLRRPTAVQAAALPLHRKGSFYANFHKGAFGSVVLDRQWDAILYIPSSTTTLH